MRLFLSSSLFGDHGDKLVEMAGIGARVAVIPNALDNFPNLKLDYMADTVWPLFRNLGLRAKGFDLKRYFANPKGLSADLSKFDVIWAIGGNSFLLRRAMYLSGFDTVVGPLLQNSPIIYGGWSAGSVVAGLDLYGIDQMDNPLATAPGYAAGDLLLDGLGLVDATLVPHFQSAHPESHAASASVALIEATGRRVIALKDGQVLIQDGSGGPMLLA